MNTKILLLIEAPPKDKTLYKENTIQAFKDAGKKVNNPNDIHNLGVEIVTVFDKPSKSYSIPAKVIEKASFKLEKKLAKYKNLKAIILMGDVAIKAVNYIAKRQFGERAIPAGSTYKIRKNKFYLGKIRVFPSYLQTGKNYLIEKSKRRMIAEDIRRAFKL